MESLLVAWRLLLMAGIFAFPVLLGVLLYFRLDRAPRWVAAMATILAPAVFFVWLAPIYLFADVRAAQARGASCGMPAMAAALFLYAGIALELAFGVVTLAALSAGRRHKKSANSTSTT